MLGVLVVSGVALGFCVGWKDGDPDPTCVGLDDGSTEGFTVIGYVDGINDDDKVGLPLGILVGFALGLLVGMDIGEKEDCNFGFVLGIRDVVGDAKPKSDGP